MNYLPFLKFILMAPINTWVNILLATDLLYSHSSDNMIHIVEYVPTQYESYIDYSANKLTVENFGIKKDALVAINGGYHGFNSPDSKGPITKLAIDGNIIVSENNITILNQNGLDVEHVNSILSIDESRHFINIGTENYSYIYSGPLLMKNGVKTTLNSKWDNVNNPRTIICIKPEKILFIIIDGRQKDVQGMTLIQVQSFLHDINCQDAINMDGGGSTTLYIKGYGVVNTPRSSDGNGGYKTIQRSVSSFIYIK